MAKHVKHPRNSRPLHPHEYKSPHQIAFEIAYVRPAINGICPPLATPVIPTN